MKKLQWYIKQGETLKSISVSELILLTSTNKALRIIETTKGNDVLKIVEFVS